MQIQNNVKIDNTDYYLIENHYKCSISTEIRDFLNNFNGEIVDPEGGLEITYNTFDEQAIADYFPNILHTKEIIEQLPYIDYIEDFFDNSELSRNDVEVEYLLPIIEVCGGSLGLYIALDGNHKDKIFMVDNGDFGICKIAESLADLSSRLKTT